MYNGMAGLARKGYGASAMRGRLANCKKEQGNMMQRPSEGSSPYAWGMFSLAPEYSNLCEDEQRFQRLHLSRPTRHPYLNPKPTQTPALLGATLCAALSQKPTGFKAFRNKLTRGPRRAGCHTSCSRRPEFSPRGAT